MEVNKRLRKESTSLLALGSRSQVLDSRRGLDGMDCAVLRQRDLNVVAACRVWMTNLPAYLRYLYLPSRATVA